MTTVRRMAALLLLMPTLVFTQSACAEDAAVEAKYQAGTHYEVLPNPARTLDPNKIEVMEVFWYGCSHCYAIEPLLAKWKETIADDVIFAKTPAVWRDFMRLHANVYYTAEAFNLPREFHNEIFALLAASPKLADEDRFAEVFAKYGVNKEDFSKKVNAFGIMSKVSQGEKRTRKNYLIQGTPEMVVNGKYRISSRMAGSQAGMLDVVNYLVELERTSK